MAKALKCPQCGSGNSKKISDTEFECVYCSTILYIEKPSHKPAINPQDRNNAAEQMNQAYGHARRTSRMIAVIIITVLIVILGFVFYMTQQSMNDYKNTMDDVKKQFEQVNP